MLLTQWKNTCPSTAKEQHELLLNNKDKKVHKVSKTVKNPDNGDIKSVTVRHVKTASNLWKPRTPSKIITQELETVEKTNIHDIELVIIKHPKAVTKLYKLKKLLANNQAK